MLLIAVFKRIRQWNMSCVLNVSQCIAVSLVWRLGEGVLPEGRGHRNDFHLSKDSVVKV